MRSPGAVYAARPPAVGDGIQPRVKLVCSTDAAVFHGTNPVIIFRAFNNATFSRIDAGKNINDRNRNRGLAQPFYCIRVALRLLKHLPQQMRGRQAGRCENLHTIFTQSPI